MKKYFFSNGQDRFGPFTLEELKFESVDHDTLIWREGLDDWTPAKNLDEMKPVLELIPPPIEEIEIKKNVNESVNTKNRTKSHNAKEGSQGWIIAGFIFALLGGFLGVIIGLNYAFGNYKTETKNTGWAIVIFGVISWVVWGSIQK